jgi:hypothetical protein
MTSMVPGMGAVIGTKGLQEIIGGAAPDAKEEPAVVTKPLPKKN